MVPGFRMRPAPVASGRLKGEEFGPPTFRCDAGPLGRNRVGVFIGEVPHDLPADRRVRIEETASGVITIHSSFLTIRDLN